MFSLSHTPLCFILCIPTGRYLRTLDDFILNVNGEMLQDFDRIATSDSTNEDYIYYTYCRCKWKRPQSNLIEMLVLLLRFFHFHLTIFCYDSKWFILLLCWVGATVLRYFSSFFHLESPKKVIIIIVSIFKKKENDNFHE